MAPEKAAESGGGWSDAIGLTAAGGMALTGLISAMNQPAIAGIQAEAMKFMAQQAADAKVETAQINADTRMYESDNRLEEAKERYDFLRMKTGEDNLTARFMAMIQLASRQDQNFAAVQIAFKNAQVEERQIQSNHDVAIKEIGAQEKELDVRLAEANRPESYDPSDFSGNT